MHDEGPVDADYEVVTHSSNRVKVVGEALEEGSAPLEITITTSEENKMLTIQDTVSRAEPTVHVIGSIVLIPWGFSTWDAFTGRSCCGTSPFFLFLS